MPIFCNAVLLMLSFIIFSKHSFGDDVSKSMDGNFILPDVLTGSGEIIDYRASWKTVTGFEDSGLHWNSFIRIFINDAKAKEVYSNNFAQYLLWYEAFEDDEDETEDPNYKLYSVGTVIIKENYTKVSDKPDQPLALSVMVKRESGYDKNFGDWEYLQIDPKGNILMRGNSSDEIIEKSCQACHSNVPEKDFIFSSFLSRPVLSVIR